jgi:GxxExxY protein
MEYLHQDLTAKIIGVYHDVYSELGHGFLEKLYRRAMLIAFRDAGLSAATDARFEVMFRGQGIGHFYPDVVVEDRVLLEIKATNALQAFDEAQTLNYLRASPIEVALLMNFGPKREVKRRVLTNDRKAPTAQANESP